MSDCNLVLSIFPGIGLLDSAFELEGFVVVRGPDVLWGGDIRAFHPPAGKFDGVIGGPPCQSFSTLAHLVRASGREVKFGNLIPEFSRCVSEAKPRWFLMENVRAAPRPVIQGYSWHSFLLDNSWLPGDGVFGQEQMRKRQFVFGLAGAESPAHVPDLRRWIDLAPLLLPDARGTATQWTPDNSKAAKTRHECVTGGHDKPPSKRIGNGKPQYRQKAVCAMQGSESKRPGTDRVYARRYRLPDACRLQGLPEDFLADSPFTAEGKLKAVANGVPLPMGRAIARAIKEAVNSHKA